jgi:nucleoid-associated protein YgaU
MGLFDFVKNVGNKLFSSESQADRKIEEHIRANNPGIKDLKVSYKNPVAYLSGDAPSAEALQKAVLMAGNVQGVESVNVDNIKVPATFLNPKAVESHQGTQYYIVQSGDTLSKIAQRFYGDPLKYSKIFDANREVIQNADLIFPGQKIRIPAENLNPQVA